MINRLSRRAALTLMGALTGSKALARGLPPTPAQTAGPFYPDAAQRPADDDADLVKIEGNVRAAGGEILHLKGRVLGRGARPVANARVEIWQCDANGRYLHPGDRSAHAPRDPDFQGYGQVLTGPDGGFAFRTIKPVPYPGRTPHIHARIHRPDGLVLTTQLYIAEDPRNARDWIFRSLGARGQQAASLVLVERGDGDWDGSIDVVL